MRAASSKPEGQLACCRGVCAFVSVGTFANVRTACEARDGPEPGHWRWGRWTRRRRWTETFGEWSQRRRTSCMGDPYSASRPREAESCTGQTPQPRASKISLDSHTSSLPLPANSAVGAGFKSTRRCLIITLMWVQVGVGPLTMERGRGTSAPARAPPPGRPCLCV